MHLEERIRSKIPAVPRSFYGNKKGVKLGPGSKIGTVQRFSSSGALLESSDRLLTGSLRDSYANEMCWDEVHPGPPFITGGNFSKMKVLLPSASVKGFGTYTSEGNPNMGSEKLVYKGGFCSPSFTLDGVSYDDYVATGPRDPWKKSNFPDLSAYELEAWDRIRPTPEKAGFSQFAAELRDLPGMLSTSAKGFREAWYTFGGKDGPVVMQPKSAANHFLNHNFGWVPFINDLYKFFDVYQNSEKYIQDAIRNNGMLVRRRRVLRDSFNETVVSKMDTYDMEPILHGLYPGLFMPQVVNGNTVYGRSEVKIIDNDKIWAEGVFTQYRPEFDPDLLTFPSEWSNIKRLLTLYGARINPAVVWRITPWTWLIDWFFGVGRNIEIATSTIEDSVCARYAYLMRHRDRKVVQNNTVYFASGAVNVSWSRQLETKQRQSMLSPYGFRVAWDSLSPKQLAILGAIGITRGT